MAPAKPLKRKLILESADKRSSESREVLVKLFRDMLGYLGIREDIWDRLLKHFLMDPKNGISQDPKDRSSAQGNLNKALFADTMTWRTFVKAIRILSYMLVYMRIEIHYQKPGGPIVSNGIDLLRRSDNDVVINNIEALSMDDDDDEEDTDYGDEDDYYEDD